VRGVGGAVGRTLASVVPTIQDATPDFNTILASVFTRAVLRKGGLRGGSAAFSNGGTNLVLHSVSFIPGVRVSGSLTHLDQLNLDLFDLTLARRAALSTHAAHLPGGAPIGLRWRAGRGLF
jgi:hypothetical protein